MLSVLFSRYHKALTIIVILTKKTWMKAVCHSNNVVQPSSQKNHLCPGFRAAAKIAIFRVLRKIVSVTIFCVARDFSLFFIMLIITRPKRVADLTKKYTPSRVLERINNSRVAQPELTSLEERIYIQWYGHLSSINGSVWSNLRPSSGTVMNK